MVDDERGGGMGGVTGPGAMECALIPVAHKPLSNHQARILNTFPGANCPSVTAGQYLIFITPRGFQYL